MSDKPVQIGRVILLPPLSDIDPARIAQAEAEFNAMTIDQLKEHFPAIYTIYHQQPEYPGHYVVVCSYGPKREPQIFVTPDIEAARRYCHQSGACYPLPREAADHHTILENWI